MFVGSAGLVAEVLDRFVSFPKNFSLMGKSVGRMSGGGRWIGLVGRARLLDDVFLAW